MNNFRETRNSSNIEPDVIPEIVHSAKRIESYAKVAEKSKRRIKYIGENPDLISGKLYTYTELGAVCGVVGQTMRGRLRGRLECTDDLLWKNGVRIPKELWKANIICRLECEADRMSQKWLRIAL
tara:strand:+ start:3098 stop:3472 length:375 start_codon:yes stop_codon:yes gene_type:complete